MMTSLQRPRMRSLVVACRQRGLSLIEMMVGLSIGLFLTLGLFTLISNTSQSFKVQDDFARMQDNAAAAFRYIGSSLRLAGFYGYTDSPNTIDTAIGGVATTTDCGSATNLPTTNWALSVAVPISGFNALTPITANAALPCIAIANFLSVPTVGQQILVARGAVGVRIPDPNADGNLSDGLAAQTDFATTIYVQSNAAGGVLFYGNNFATMRAANPPQTLRLSTGVDVDIFEYQTHVYYLRPCSRIASGSTCSATADDNKPIPTLVRQELRGSVMTEVALAEGIERMSFLYGIDTLPAGALDGVADTFTANPSTADWANVVTVRVTLLARSATPSAQIDDSNKTYDLNGDNVADFRCQDMLGTEPYSCQFRRKVFTQLFQLRNIAQRRGM